MWPTLTTSLPLWVASSPRRRPHTGQNPHSNAGRLANPRVLAGREVQVLATAASPKGNSVPNGFSLSPPRPGVLRPGHGRACSVPGLQRAGPCPKHISAIRPSTGSPRMTPGHRLPGDEVSPVGSDRRLTQVREADGRRTPPGMQATLTRRARPRIREEEIVPRGGRISSARSESLPIPRRRVPARQRTIHPVVGRRCPDTHGTRPLMQASEERFHWNTLVANFTAQ
jgi:hypothetical protein